MVNTAPKGFSHQSVEELKTRINAVEVIGDYIEIKQTRTSHVALCPFHDDHNPSLGVTDKGYRCFACDASGDAIKFVMEYQKVSFPEAIVLLADKYNVPLNPANGRHFVDLSDKLPPRKASKNKFEPTPPPPPKGELQLVRLAEVPAAIPQQSKFFDEKRGEVIRTTYVYSSDNQRDVRWVTREEWEDASSKKGRSKKFCQWHRATSGEQIPKWVDGKKTTVEAAGGESTPTKGEAPWEAYRSSEAIAAAQGYDYPILLAPLEGEKNVEIARSIKLASFTFQGSSWRSEETEKAIAELNTGCRNGVALAFLVDNDDAGRKKAKKFIDSCASFNVFVVAVDTVTICPELADVPGADIEQILQHMSADEFIRRLEVEIHKAVAARRIEAEARANNDGAGNGGNANGGGSNGGSGGNGGGNKCGGGSSGDGGGDNHHYSNQRNREARYWTICEGLGLPFEDCITTQMFEKHVFEKVFEAGKGSWKVINSTFYRYNVSGYWEAVSDGAIHSLICDATDNTFKLKYTKEFGWADFYPYATNNHCESAFKYCRKHLELQNRPESGNLRAFSNCTVDMGTGETIPHSPEHYLTTGIPYEYHPNRPCPDVFYQFLCDAYGENLIPVIRAFTSMFLDPTAPYGVFPHLIGLSGSGKGTLGRLWNNLFGGNNSSSGFFSDISSAEGRHQYLTGKSIFGIPDIGGYVTGLRAFYEMVDNGEMTGRALYNPTGYQKRWNVRFWVGSVDHLQVENAGDGWERRAYPIPTKGKPDNIDPSLRLKLEEVKADIISWALAMPREERDLILLVPPSNERIVNIKHDAALYGDSAKSFVDLCLRPAEHNCQVPNHHLHSLYVAYCQTHGYTPMGMSKFISHLKTILPKNHVARYWQTMVNGKRQMQSAHWQNLSPLAGVFIDLAQQNNNDRNGYAGSSQQRQQEPEWKCLKSKCVEGGLMEFEDFWNPQPPDDTDPNCNGGDNPPPPTPPSTSEDLKDKDSTSSEKNESEGNNSGEGGKTPSDPSGSSNPPHNPTGWRDGQIFPGDRVKVIDPHSEEFAKHGVMVAQTLLGEVEVKLNGGVTISVAPNHIELVATQQAWEEDLATCLDWLNSAADATTAKELWQLAKSIAVKLGAEFICTVMGSLSQEKRSQLQSWGIRW